MAEDHPYACNKNTHPRHANPVDRRCHYGHSTGDHKASEEIVSRRRGGRFLLIRIHEHNVEAIERPPQRTSRRRKATPQCQPRMNRFLAAIHKQRRLHMRDRSESGSLNVELVHHILLPIRGEFVPVLCCMATKFRSSKIPIVHLVVILSTPIGR